MRQNKQPWKPEVGQFVRLRSDAMSRLRLDSWEDIDAARRCQITRVENINAGTDWPAIWVINVTGPINRYMLESSMFDRLEN